MANFFKDRDRRVIPNWRSYGKTTVLGELSSFQLNAPDNILEVGIDEYVIDWKINKTMVHASDLLSASIVNNKRNHDEVKNAAEFIINNKKIATFSQLSLANNILNLKEVFDVSHNFNSVDLNQVNTIINSEEIRTKIKDVKRMIRLYSFNPIYYVELSRYYSILGQETSSLEAMKTALHLSKDNRFVLRSATRLFSHINYDDNEYVDYIHNILKKSNLTKIDPWLMSAEISLATLKGRSSNFIRKGIELINSNNNSAFSYTELASSIGTVELLAGSHKKSRIFFNKALINPNDNSLAQVEWASGKDKGIIVDTKNSKVKMNYEALALDSFQNEDFESSLENTTKWLKDIPFSKRPVMFGSNLASIVLKDNNKSILFLKAGQISHPNDPQIINNLAYAYSLNNEPEKAFIELNKVNMNFIDDDIDACLKATRGLAQFRIGKYDEGRENYHKAIEQTKASSNRVLNWIAILNYAREEVKINSQYVENLMTIVDKIPNNVSEIEINTLKKDVVELYEKNKAKISKDYN